MIVFLQPAQAFVFCLPEAYTMLMQLLPFDAFSTPGMMTMAFMVIVVQVVSLLLMGLGLREYGRIDGRHRDMLAAMHLEHAGEKQWHRHSTSWVYAFSTIMVMIITSVLFLWQPHLL